MSALLTYHPEERLIGEAHVTIDSRQNTEYQAYKHHHEPVTQSTECSKQSNATVSTINFILYKFQRIVASIRLSTDGLKIGCMEI